MSRPYDKGLGKKERIHPMTEEEAKQLLEDEIKKLAKESLDKLTEGLEKSTAILEKMNTDMKKVKQLITGLTSVQEAIIVKLQDKNITTKKEIEEAAISYMGKLEQIAKEAKAKDDAKDNTTTS